MWTINIHIIVLFIALERRKENFSNFNKKEMYKSGIHQVASVSIPVGAYDRMITLLVLYYSCVRNEKIKFQNELTIKNIY